MLVFEQNVNMQVCVAGVHPVAYEERAVSAIQNLDPDPGELFCGTHDLHLEGALAWGRRQTTRHKVSR